jgi:hypothetical protein
MEPEILNSLASDKRVRFVAIPTSAAVSCSSVTIANMDREELFKGATKQKPSHEHICTILKKTY